MNALFDMVAPPRTTGGWLALRGWAPGKADRWQHPTPIPLKGERKGRPLLHCRHGGSQWETWLVLRGAIVPPATDVAPGEGVLIANAKLAGPGKFVDTAALPQGQGAAARGAIDCRFDLPRELLGHQGDGNFSDIAYPIDSWAKDVTALATGTARPARAAAPDVVSVHMLLDKAAWPTTSADGLLRISTPLPGLFRQILIDVAGAHGPRLWCELVDLAGWPAHCRQAAIHLALAANARLRLVRFALVGQASNLSHDSDRLETCPTSLVAEVVLGSARVPGAWLDVALECLHSAVVLSARELSALRDPELANWYLAAHGLSAKEA